MLGAGLPQQGPGAPLSGFVRAWGRGSGVSSAAPAKGFPPPGRVRLVSPGLRSAVPVVSPRPRFCSLLPDCLLHAHGPRPLPGGPQGQRPVEQVPGPGKAALSLPCGPRLQPPSRLCSGHSCSDCSTASTALPPAPPSTPRPPPPPGASVAWQPPGARQASHRGPGKLPAKDQLLDVGPRAAAPRLAPAARGLTGMHSLPERAPWEAGPSAAPSARPSTRALQPHCCPLTLPTPPGVQPLWLLLCPPLGSLVVSRWSYKRQKGRVAGVGTGEPLPPPEISCGSATIP